MKRIAILILSLIPLFALARGMSGDFDVKYTIASTGSVVCASLCFFYSIRYNKTIKKNKE